MEPVTNVPLTLQNIDPYPSLTLEEARERIRTLLSNEESNAWDLGDLLNAIEKRGLARSKGYGKTRTWLDAEVPEAQGKTSTLYRYADVASHYTKENVELWGVTKLACLSIHDREVLGFEDSGEPGEREVQILQEDGSTSAKKFRDCTLRELRLSNQRRKKASKGPGHAKKAHPTQEVHSISKALALLVLGILVTATFALLPDSLPITLVLVFGTGLVLSGIAMLIHHWQIARERLLSAFKEGKPMDVLKDKLAKARRGGVKLAAAVRSRVKAKRPTTASKEATPPTEKKAA
jgi:hypothetical protein